LTCFIFVNEQLFVDKGEKIENLISELVNIPYW
jgi:hypothetical protein